MQNVMRYVFILAFLACCAWFFPVSAFSFGDVYVVKPKIHMRAGPGVNHESRGLLRRNASLYSLEKNNNWTRVATMTGKSGWVRSDFLSSKVLHIHMQERELLIVGDRGVEVVFPISPGEAGMPFGRYFLSPAGTKRFLLTWPNRADFRAFLAAGSMDMDKYIKAIKIREAFAGNGLALCSEAAAGDNCGAIVSASDFPRLSATILGQARVEIYRDAAEDAALNQPDEFSYQIYLGAKKQLEYPAAGLRPGARLPELSYPGGDIQPDFAASADIVIRAVRHAGVDLQTLVLEDTLLHPARYEGLDKGDGPYGLHRSVPVLFAYLSHNALSLPTDVDEDLLGFESGDIVFLSSGGNGERVPDRVGVVSETYDNAGVPLVITVWGMGQITRLHNVLARKGQAVVGHYRMTHLFDYQ